MLLSRRKTNTEVEMCVYMCETLNQKTRGGIQSPPLNIQTVLFLYLL